MKSYRIKTFGMLAEKLEGQELVVPYCPDSESLVETIYSQYPNLNDFNFSVAVDKKLIHGNTSLNGNEEIALLPPFSGG